MDIHAIREHASRESTRSSVGAAFNTTLAAATVVAVATVLVGIVSRLHGLMIEDDAFIFVRYATNVLEHGTVSWNPGGPATYGVTSLLYLGLVTLVRATTDAPATVAVVSSGLAGVLLAGVVGLTLWLWLPTDRLIRTTAAFLVLGTAALSIDSLAAHFATGMDTTFAMMFVALLALAGKSYEVRPTRSRLLAVVATATLAFYARPDLGVFSLAVLIALAAWRSTRGSRLHTYALLLAPAGLLGVLVLVTWAYFGSPVPLSFYVKSLVRYGEGMELAFARVPWRELSRYIESHWLLLVPILARLIWSLKSRTWNYSPTETGCLVAVIAFVVYYRLFALQVMPHYQRFYYPTLPALILLAARSLPRGFDASWAGVPDTMRRPRIAFAAAIALVALVTGAHLRAWPHAFGRIEQQTVFYRLSPLDNHNGNFYTWWAKLEELSALPDDAVWATTEVGLPGVLNPRRAIIDMSGLNEPEFARNRFDADVFFANYSPDLIYLPPPDYREMTLELVAHPIFREQYIVIPPKALDATLGLAFRKSSPHLNAMQRTLASR